MRFTVAHKLLVAGATLVALAAAAGLLALEGATDVEALARLAGAPTDGSLIATTALERAQRIRGVLAAGSIALAVLLPWAALTLVREVARRRAVERALAESEARFRAAIDGSQAAFYVLRAVSDAEGAVLDFEFLDLNREAESVLRRPRAMVIGQRLCELVPSNRTNGFLDAYVRVMRTGRTEEGEYEVADAGVRAGWIQYQIVALGDGVAVTSRDISERKQHEDALRALSLVDELTGLYNRRGFLTLAQQQLKAARRSQRELVLLFVDMDDFKAINDRHGHQAGDVALRQTAAILRRTFRDSDIVARLGGDEFVVLATDIARGSGPLIVERLRGELRERNAADGHPYTLSFSVGLATFDPARPPELEELLATADAMLYEQKRHRHAATEPVGVPG